MHSETHGMRHEKIKAPRLFTKGNMAWVFTFKPLALPSLFPLRSLKFPYYSHDVPYTAVTPLESPSSIPAFSLQISHPFSRVPFHVPHESSHSCSHYCSPPFATPFQCHGVPGHRRQYVPFEVIPVVFGGRYRSFPACTPGIDSGVHKDTVMRAAVVGCKCSC